MFWPVGRKAASLPCWPVLARACVGPCWPALAKFLMGALLSVFWDLPTQQKNNLKANPLSLLRQGSGGSDKETHAKIIAKTDVCAFRRHPSQPKCNFRVKSYKKHWENEGRVHGARIFTVSYHIYESHLTNQCKFSIDSTCIFYAVLRWFWDTHNSL